MTRNKGPVYHWEKQYPCWVQTNKNILNPQNIVQKHNYIPKCYILKFEPFMERVLTDCNFQNKVHFSTFVLTLTGSIRHNFSSSLVEEA